jgi:cytidyltransferase-like protein
MCGIPWNESSVTAIAWNKPVRVALVSGVFDPIHAGHIAYLHAAREYGAVICVLSDAPWKHPVLVPIDQRQRVLEALGVFLVRIVQDVATEIPAIIEADKPDYYLKGLDWSGKLPAAERAACAAAGTTIVYTATMEASSSQLLEDYVRRRQETQP